MRRHYTGKEYQALLARHGLAVSRSFRNGRLKGFVATHKTELVHDARWAKRAEATTALAADIKCWCNRRRRHSTLDYLSSAEYELRLRVA